MTEVASSATSTGSGGFATLQEELAYYKSQYEQLDVELQEFQASSRELEAELERDVEASEKRERNLKEKVESSRFEVDEWKTKYKQSKSEASAAQTTLQKEITTLRDSNRTLQLKLRDIEVANDDFERQARHTTSSLEDMESKYSQTIERGVMLEEEIRAGEQEREALRIETQRLRDELSDLKVEAEITQEKLRAFETGGARRLKRLSQVSDSRSQGPRSPMSDRSTGTTGSTPTTSTPPTTKSGSSTVNSDAPTPPSPVLSDTAKRVRKTAQTHRTTPASRPSMARDPNITPRPSLYAASRPSQHTRGPSINPLNGTTPSFSRKGINPRPSGVNGDAVPRSGSLYQIRGLIGKMQKLEERVQSVKSKLPAPTSTPPRASPRGTTLTTAIPSSVTVRSSKKRTSGSIVTATTLSQANSDESSRRLAHRQSRISLSGAQSINDSASRPSSRASNVSAAGGRDNNGFVRPSSRASMMGRTEPVRPASVAEARRPRSSMSGTYSSASHNYNQVSRAARVSIAHEDNADTEFSTPTPRRTTMDRNGIASIPTPASLRRQSSTLSGIPQISPRKSMGTFQATSNGAVDDSNVTVDGELGETF